MISKREVGLYKSGQACRYQSRQLQMGSTRAHRELAFLGAWGGAAQALDFSRGGAQPRTPQFHLELNNGLFQMYPGAKRRQLQVGFMALLTGFGAGRWTVPKLAQNGCLLNFNAHPPVLHAQGT